MLAEDRRGGNILEAARRSLARHMRASQRTLMFAAHRSSRKLSNDWIDRRLSITYWLRPQSIS